MRAVLKNLRLRRNAKLISKQEPSILFLFYRSFLGSTIAHGKRLAALNRFNEIKLELKLKERFNPEFIFLVAMLLLVPNITLRPQKMGGVTYGVPSQIHQNKQISLAVKWFLRALVKPKIENFVDLLINTYNEKGPAIDKKYQYYQTAKDNRHLISYLR